MGPPTRRQPRASKSVTRRQSRRGSRRTKTGNNGKSKVNLGGGVGGPTSPSGEHLPRRNSGDLCPLSSPFPGKRAKKGEGTRSEVLTVRRKPFPRCQEGRESRDLTRRRRGSGLAADGRTVLGWGAGSRAARSPAPGEVEGKMCSHFCVSVVLRV